MQESSSAARFMNKAQAVSQKTYFPALLLAVLTLVAVSAITPFYVRHRTGIGAEDTRQGMIWTHDMVNHQAVAEMFYKGIKSGVIYPRWLADANNGYGIPLMVYYPPGFYYLTSAIQDYTEDWGNTMLIASILLFVASGMAFYFFARVFMSNLAAALASVTYMMFPYHMLDLYHRGAMAELFGFVFIPLIMYFAYRVATEGRLRQYGGLGLCYGLYLISHMPVGYMFSYALAIYAVVWTIMKRDLRIAVRIAAGMVLGLALGAVYWLPAVMEGRYAQEEVTSSAPYLYSFITMVVSSDPFDHVLHAQFWLLVLALIAVIVFLSKSWRRAGTGVEGEEEAGLRTQARLWMILAVGATFMSTSFSTYISMLIPRIQASTPAWRFLTIATVFASMLIGLAIDRARERAQMASTNRKAWKATISAATALNVLFTVGMIVVATIYHLPQPVAENFNSLSFNPAGATRVEDLPDTTRVVTDPLTRWTEVQAWDPEYRRIRMQVTEPTLVRLKTYYFPGWSALIDGQPTEVSSDIDGVQLITVPPGIHVIESYFAMTRVRKAAAISFASALLLITGLVVADYLKERKRREGESGSDAALDPYGEADFELEAQPAAQKRSLVTHWKKIAATCAIIVGALIVFNMFGSSKKQLEQSHNNQDGATVTSDADARLFITGRDWIAAATDEKSLDLLMARGDNNIKLLLDSGRAIQLPNNTRVRVIQNVSAKTQVRIMEGDYTGTTAWVHERWVQN
jgi:4-amino-4-deoxy-L-arabinose transferase-like glycosyltransferase